jgi:two-component system sensor histidine kinase QseC
MSLLERARSSLKGRLLLSLALGLGLSVGLGFFLLHVLIRNTLYDQLDSEILLHLDGIAEFALENPGREDTAEFDPEFRARAHQDYFQVWDGTGRVLARSDSSRGRDLPFKALVPGRTTAPFAVTLPDGHRGRAIARSIVLPAGDPRGTLAVVMAAETEKLDALEASVHRLLALGAAAIVLVGLLVTNWSVNRGLAPVRELARIAESADPADFSTELHTEGLPTELRPVAGRLASLVEHLFAAVARERRFSRNVAHELRNPLAEVRMLADVGAMTASLEDARARMGEIRETTQELEEIVRSLLTLARIESGRENPQTEPIDLVAEIRRELAHAMPAGEPGALRLDLRLPAEYWVLADSSLLKRLLTNITGNALEHAPKGSTVEIGIDEDGLLSVSNEAPQLSEGDIPKLGERFFRVDSCDEAVHAGLGLSLAQAIAGVLGLHFELRLTPGRRLVARISGFEKLPG